MYREGLPVGLSLERDVSPLRGDTCGWKPFETGELRTRRVALLRTL